jgi:hypothetical protein
MNLDTSDGPGYHWVATYFTPTAVEYYNSFGKAPTAGYISQMKEVMEKVNPDGIFKMKVNHIQRQDNNTTDCGYHAMKFIQDRIAGRSWAASTGYDDHRKDDHVNGEKAVTKFIHHLHGGAFLHTYQTEQDGEGLIDKAKAVVQRVKDVLTGVRKKASPSIRKFVEADGNAKITKIVIGREPIRKGVETVLSWLSLGKYDANKKSLGYDQMFHLFMIITLSTGKTFKMEKNEVPEISFATNAGNDTMNVKAPNVTFKDFLQNAERVAGGDKLWVYDAVRANCQDFVLACLRGSRVLTPAISKFVKQNAVAVLEGMSWFEKAAKKITDTANVIDVVKHGQNDAAAPPNAFKDPNISENKSTLTV